MRLPIAALLWLIAGTGLAISQAGTGGGSAGGGSVSPGAVAPWGCGQNGPECAWAARTGCREHARRPRPQQCRREPADAKIGRRRSRDPAHSYGRADGTKCSARRPGWAAHRQGRRPARRRPECEQRRLSGMHGDVEPVKYRHVPARVVEDLRQDAVAAEAVTRAGRPNLGVAKRCHGRAAFLEILARIHGNEHQQL